MERSADWIDQARGDWEHAPSDLERGFYEWTCFSADRETLVQRLRDQGAASHVARDPYRAVRRLRPGTAYHCERYRPAGHILRTEAG